MPHAAHAAPPFGTASGPAPGYHERDRVDGAPVRPDPAAKGSLYDSANERFKRREHNVYWIGLTLAALAHFLIFAYWPQMSVADVSFATSELESIELPPEIEIPPPPEQIARPATPVAVADALVDEDITIAPTTFEANPIENLPPPPASSQSGDLAAAPVFTPYSVAPELRNRAEIARLLVRKYPPVLRDARITGTVLVWFLIDETGHVQKSLIHTSSGYEQFDHAAIEVANEMVFSPALNRDQKVPVWVALPIIFTIT